MQLSPRRLICRAHNRYDPAIALWKHFVAPIPPTLHHWRQSSNTADSAHNDHSSKAVSAGAQQESKDIGQEVANGAQNSPKFGIPRVRFLTTRKGHFAPNSKGSPLSKSPKEKRTDADKAIEDALSISSAAFSKSEDYEGVAWSGRTANHMVKEQELPWVLEENERNMSGIDRLNIEIERFSQYAKPDHWEAIARQHVITQVKDHVRMTDRQYKLECFGSEKTGLAFATSDIDLRFMLPKFSDDTGSPLPPSPDKRAITTKKLRALFYRNLNNHKDYSNRHLLNARYPLISLKDKRSGIDVQIVNANDTTLSREIMADYMRQYPYLGDLFFVVKAMFDVRGLSDVFKGGFGSYTVFMMLAASLKSCSEPPKDAARALFRFLRFFERFDMTKRGISIDPIWYFAKNTVSVMDRRTRIKVEQGISPPLPPYMLCLRDPADEHNDLGRKASAVKHAQVIFQSILVNLQRDISANTRHSLLRGVVGCSYELNKEQRDRLRKYGMLLHDQPANKANTEGAQEIESGPADEVCEEPLQGIEPSGRNMHVAKQEGMAREATIRQHVIERKNEMRRRLTEQRNNQLRADLEAMEACKPEDFAKIDWNAVAKWSYDVEKPEKWDPEKASLLEAEMSQEEDLDDDELPKGDTHDEGLVTSSKA